MRPDNYRDRLPFERGELGFEVESSDIKGIAAILRKLQAEHDFRQRLSANAADVMSEYYQWKPFRRRLLQAVEPILDRRSPART